MSNKALLAWTVAILGPIALVSLAVITDMYLGLTIGRFLMNWLASWLPLALPLFNICVLLSPGLLLLPSEGYKGVKSNWRPGKAMMINHLIGLILVILFAFYNNGVLQYIAAWMLGCSILPKLWKDLKARQLPIPHDQPLQETPSLAYEQGYQEQTQASISHKPPSTEPANTQPTLAAVIDYEQPLAYYPQHSLPMTYEE